jgi:putative SOS response-associated peptidase YedK
LPVDSFFEKATRSAKARQPFAIGMQTGEPFGIGAIWENWKRPSTDDWIRTFCVITCPANAFVAHIHDRMPVILDAADYERWLGDEPDPSDLLVPFPSNPMKVWPISTRVNKPVNDDAAILELVDDATLI